MRRTRRKIDKVRASRDGHEFHEAWTARKVGEGTGVRSCFFAKLQRARLCNLITGLEKYDRKFHFEYISCSDML